MIDEMIASIDGKISKGAQKTQKSRTKME